MDERIFVIVVFNLDQSPENDFYKICFFKKKYGGGGFNLSYWHFLKFRKLGIEKLYKKVDV